MLGLGRVGVRLGVDHQGVAVRPVGDPELGPVQDVVVLQINNHTYFFLRCNAYLLYTTSSLNLPIYFFSPHTQYAMFN